MTGRGTTVGPGVHLLDLGFQGEAGVIGAYLVESDGELTLIETGPGSTVEALLDGVRAAGFEPERIGRVLVTHIHLDHAGGAGVLLRRLPEATLYAHPIGVPHLIDPSRLVASATRIYGDRMDELWGEIAPVPEDRIVALEDGARVPIGGGRELVALDTPGHANHHLAYHDEPNGMIYTGDVAGVRLGGAPYVRPPTPPPELDLERWRESLLRLRRLAPKRLCLTHFGAYDDVDWHLDDQLARLFYWAGWVRAGHEAGEPADELVGRLQRLGDAEIRKACRDPAAARLYELATNYDMTVGGYVRYFRKREERAG